jgi:Fe-S-cluster containining protein
MIYHDDITQAYAQQKPNKKLVQRLKKMPEKEVDRAFHTLHDDVFEKIDCLQCANCCKTTSPIFRDVDIERLAKRLRTSVADFQSNYLRLDEDQDYVLQSSPCVFLNEDNTCSVYEDRPKACREYPHTDRKKMQQILDLTLKNTLICPAVSRIFQSLKKM